MENHVMKICKIAKQQMPHAANAKDEDTMIPCAVNLRDQFQKHTTRATLQTLHPTILPQRKQLQ